MLPVTPLIKPILKTASVSDSRIVNTLHTNNKILGDLVTDTRIYNDGHNRLISEIKNRMGKRLGHEIFALDTERRVMSGYYIEVEPEYRRKNYGFGELLRLSSIITMLENKMTQFEILSKNTAVYFHSKYKFSPSVIGFDDRDNILKSILKNCPNPLDEITKRAIGFVERLKVNPTNEEKRTITRETNILAQDYINRVLSQNVQKENPFIGAMDMKLTAEKIFENKDFFNNLFKKHGIDYEIRL